MTSHFKRCIRRISLERKNPTLCQAVRHRFKRRQKILKRLKLRAEEREFRLSFKKSVNVKSDIPPYLTKNSWEHELNYKLWITKSARFCAAKRCEAIDNYGLWATTILSAYLIIVGLIPYIPHPLFKSVSPELLGFGTTALSILLMAYSLLIAGRQYPLQAKAFHECALQIGILYDELRQAKEIKNLKEKRMEIMRITKRYEGMLPHYPNHLAIDHSIFQTQKPAYFKLNWLHIAWRKMKLYFHTRAILDVILLIGVAAVVISCWHIGVDSP